MRTIRLLCAAGLLTFFSAAATSQTEPPPPPKPAPDVLLFTNGDQLTGKLERASGGSVVFKSDMAGELTIPFDKIKELRSGEQFALLRKNQKVDRANVEIGDITLTDGAVSLRPPKADQPVKVPVKDVAYLVDRDLFDKSIVHHASFIEGWNGSVTGGATLVRSTQTDTTFTAAVGLVRAIPAVSFLPPRNRTTINLSETYGKQSTPVIPVPVPPAAATVTVVSNIFHADAERDEYFSPRVYALVDTSFDHNYAQFLQLQQVYGIGVGWTALKNARQELDFKGDIHYEKQQFFSIDPNAPPPGPLEIVGSTFAESYIRHLPLKVVFTESANYLPAWNQLQAYSANFNAALSIPVFKRLSIAFATTDNYLNDPPADAQKNSYQYTTGVTYNLK